MESIDQVFRELQSTAERLGRILTVLTPAQVTARPSDGSFAFVEHLWHLADLEVEGFGARIERLLTLDNPSLPDFRGAVLARERRYLLLDADEALAIFTAARERNVDRLLTLRPEQLLRSGVQEGVGRVALADLPRLMARHDATHRIEIAALLDEIHTGTAAPAPLFGDLVTA